MSRAARAPRPLTPSAALAAVVGDEPLTRSEIVTRVWAYIHAHGLQDPADRRVILPDERLRAVFGRERVTMLSMMGLLSPHLRVLGTSSKLMGKARLATVGAAGSGFKLTLALVPNPDPRLCD